MSSAGRVPSAAGLLGSWGFAAAAFLANLPDAGLVAPSGITTVCLICSGGVAQLIEGRREHLRGSDIGATSFTASGIFWLTVSLNSVLGGLGVIGSSGPGDIGRYLLVWSAFAALMTLRAVRSGGPAVLTGVLTFLGLLVKGLGDLLGSRAVVEAGAWTFIAAAVVVFAVATLRLLGYDLRELGRRSPRRRSEPADVRVEAARV